MSSNVIKSLPFLEICSVLCVRHNQAVPFLPFTRENSGRFRRDPGRHRRDLSEACQPGTLINTN